MAMQIFPRPAVYMQRDEAFSDTSSVPLYSATRLPDRQSTVVMNADAFRRLRSYRAERLRKSGNTKYRTTQDKEMDYGHMYTLAFVTPSCYETTGSVGRRPSVWGNFANITEEELVEARPIGVYQTNAHTGEGGGLSGLVVQLSGVAPIYNNSDRRVRPNEFVFWGRPDVKTLENGTIVNKRHFDGIEPHHLLPSILTLDACSIPSLDPMILAEWLATQPWDVADALPPAIRDLKCVVSPDENPVYPKNVADLEEFKQLREQLYGDLNEDQGGGGGGHAARHGHGIGFRDMGRKAWGAFGKAARSTVNGVKWVVGRGGGPQAPPPERDSPPPANGEERDVSPPSQPPRAGVGSSADGPVSVVVQINPEQGRDAGGQSVASSSSVSQPPPGPLASKSSAVSSSSRVQEGGSISDLKKIGAERAARRAAAAQKAEQEEAARQAAVAQTAAQQAAQQARALQEAADRQAREIEAANRNRQDAAQRDAQEVAQRDAQEVAQRVAQEAAQRATQEAAQRAVAAQEAAQNATRLAAAQEALPPATAAPQAEADAGAQGPASPRDEPQKAKLGRMSFNIAAMIIYRNCQHYISTHLVGKSQNEAGPGEIIDLLVGNMR